MPRGNVTCLKSVVTCDSSKALLNTPVLTIYVSKRALQNKTVNYMTCSSPFTQDNRTQIHGPKSMPCVWAKHPVLSPRPYTRSTLQLQ